MPITYTVTVYDDRIEWKNEDLEFHREDGPAVEIAGRYKSWWLNGLRHRKDGPAVEYANGTKEWLLKGQLHREDGPAVEYANGDKSWFINGMRHREDGPAVEHVNGYKAWWLNGIELTEKEQSEQVRQPKLISCNGKIVEIDGKRYKLNEI